MNREAKYDLCRYGGGKGIIDVVMRKPQIKYIIQLRKTQCSPNKLFLMINKWRLNRLSEKTLIQIPADVSIGRGFYIGHFGRIIIHPNVVIGENCNIATGVVIGEENRGKRKGTPIIGDKVWIGANSVIVGRIAIGDEVLIAPNSYVNFDVPSCSVVVGGKIIPKKNAIEGYINNCV